MRAHGTFHCKRTHLVAFLAVMLLESTAWPQLMTCQLSSDSAWLGETVTLDVFIENVSSLRGYETAIQIVRTSGAGTVSVPCPGGVAVDETRSDYVFIGAGSTFGVPACDEFKYAQALVSGSVNVGATPAYLSDYTIEVPVDATAGSTFEISIDPTLSNLSDDAASSIPFSVGAPCVLAVRCNAGADCDDGNVCTTDFCDESLVCINDGTGVTDACDDGDPCTTDDFCQGDQSGTCAGTGSIPPDPVGPSPDGIRKNRYLTIVPGNGGAVMAIRVTPGAGNPAAGIDSLWIGPPREFPEEDASQPDGSFLGAALQCDPHFQDWGTVGVLQVFGAEVVPVTSYDVQTIAECATPLTDEGNYSAATLVDTGTWGDIVSLFAGPGIPPQPDFTDIAAVVQKFLADPDAPIKAAAQLEPNVVFPSRPISFKDIASSVAAFLSEPYPFAGACACPSVVTCEATTCTTDDQCGSGLCVDGFCRDACGRCTP